MNGEHELGELGTKCPMCWRVKTTVRQVGGPAAPPKDDGRSVIVCDVCGEVYLWDGLSGELPSPKVLEAIYAQMPQDVLDFGRQTRSTRRSHVDRAVKHVLRLRRPQAWYLEDVAGWAGPELAHHATAREVAEALQRLTRLGLVVLSPDDVNRPLWRWAGGV